MANSNISISNLIENLEFFDAKSDATGTLWKVLFLYLPPLILFQGSVGNICSFLIFFKLGNLKSKFKPETLITYSKNLASTMYSIIKQHPGPVLTESCKFKHRASSSSPSTTTGGLTIYLYLSLLALFDLGVLYFGLFNDWIINFSSINLKDYSSFICKFFTFAGYLCSHCSSSLIVITSTIRFMAVYAPFKASNLTNIKSVKLISFLLLVFFTLFNLHLFWHMKLIQLDSTTHLIDILKTTFKNSQYNEIITQLNKQIKDSQSNLAMSPKDTFKCNIVQNRFTKTLWPIADKLVYSLIPFILISLFNILILINISKVQKYKYILYVSKLKNEACSKMSIKFESHVLSEIKHNGSYLKLKQINKKKKFVSNSLSRISVCLIDNRNDVKERIIHFKKYHLVCKKFTIMLLSLSFGFLLLTLPVVVIYLILEPIRQRYERMDLNESNSHLELLQSIQKLSSLLMYLNHSINFFIYFATSSRFRQQFRKNFLSSSFYTTNAVFKLIKKCRKRKSSGGNESSLYD